MILRRRQKQNSKPVLHGEWWTIRVRKDTFSTGQQKRTCERVRLAPVIRSDGKPTPMRTVKKLADEYFQSLNRGLQLEVTPEELAIYRADPPSTPHTDFVVCLECGQKRASIAVTHLQKHGLTWKTYQSKWGAAPMYRKSSHDARNRASLKYAKKHYAAHSEEVNRARRTPAYRAKANRASRKRRAANRAAHLAYSRNWQRKKRTPRASREELDRFLKNPDTCDYVVCLEPECRAKLRDIGCNHIQKIHRLTIEQYDERHPGAPLRATRSAAPKRRESPAKSTRGRKTGELLGDTAARITMAAYLMLQGWSKGRIAVELYPLHGTKSAAKNAAYNSIFIPHEEGLTREKGRLAGLPPAIQLAAFEAAKSKISKPSISRIA
jgi:predicted transcriptional regulator